MTLTETGKSPASGVALTEGRVVVQSLRDIHIRPHRFGTIRV
jgi:hypothetical protein